MMDWGSSDNLVKIASFVVPHVFGLNPPSTLPFPHYLLIKKRINDGMFPPNFMDLLILMKLLNPRHSHLMRSHFVSSHTYMHMHLFFLFF